MTFFYLAKAVRGSAVNSCPSFYYSINRAQISNNSNLVRCRCHSNYQSHCPSHRPSHRPSRWPGRWPDRWPRRWPARLPDRWSDRWSDRWPGRWLGRWSGRWPGHFLCVSPVLAQPLALSVAYSSA